MTLAYLKPGTAEKYTGKSSLTGEKVPIDKVMFSDRQGNQHAVELGGAPPSSATPEQRASRKRMMEEIEARRRKPGLKRDTFSRSDEGTKPEAGPSTPTSDQDALRERIEGLIRDSDVKGGVREGARAGTWGLGNNPAGQLRGLLKRLGASDTPAIVDSIAKKYGLTPRSAEAESTPAPEPEAGAGAAGEAPDSVEDEAASRLPEKTDNYLDMTLGAATMLNGRLRYQGGEFDNLADFQVKMHGQVDFYLRANEGKNLTTSQRAEVDRRVEEVWNRLAADPNTVADIEARLAEIKRTQPDLENATNKARLEYGREKDKEDASDEELTRLSDEFTKALKRAQAQNQERDRLTSKLERARRKEESDAAAFLEEELAEKRRRLFLGAQRPEWLTRELSNPIIRNLRETADRLQFEDEPSNQIGFGHTQKAQEERMLKLELIEPTDSEGIYQLTTKGREARDYYVGQQMREVEGVPVDQYVPRKRADLKPAKDEWGDKAYYGTHDGKACLQQWACGGDW